jgi:hypothetical protein
MAFSFSHALLLLFLLLGRWRVYRYSRVARVRRHVATQRWVPEPWEGEDPPSLAKIWARKPKFAVNGSRSCAVLAIVHHLRNEGWHGVWVNSFGPRELRSASYRAGQRSCMT